MRLMRIVTIALMLAGPSHASWQVVPESRDQQYRTYGLLIDQQATLVMRTAGRAWGGLGGEIALIEADHLPFKPQLVLHGSASAAFRLNERNDTFLTETDDARVGLAIHGEFSPGTRATLAWMHQSGHISDNVLDADLIGPNLGNEIISYRMIHDVDRSFRFGGTLRAYVGADPGMKALGFDQFGEWFPTGVPTDYHQGAPYLAASFEQYGRNHLDFSSNYQLGYMVGNHFDPVKHTSMRAVLGYYQGNDPRLKYYQFKTSRVQFGYLGLMFEI